MNVQELLSRKGNAVYSIHPDASLSECIAMLNERRIGALLVMDANEHIHGIISERDILRVAYAKQCQICELPVRQIMTPAEKLITAAPQDSIESVMERMTNFRVRHIPVMENGEITGMVSIGDAVKSLLDYTKQENEDMRDYISGRYTRAV